MNSPAIYIGSFAIAAILSLTVIALAGKSAIDKTSAGSPLGPIVVLAIDAVAFVCQIWNHFWFHAFALVILGIGTAICAWLALEARETTRRTGGHRC